MRKIKLQLESLAVESFDTSACDSGRGTVLGQALNPPDDGSAWDNCESALGCTRFQCATTYRTCLCDPSEYDRCFTGECATIPDC